MLIDNKTTHLNSPKTIIQFFEKYLSKGTFDIVTGFFSISMLSQLKEKFDFIDTYRMILGNMTSSENKSAKIVDLLTSNSTLKTTLNLNQTSKSAVQFLMNVKVLVKTVKPNFCHEKTYIFESEDKDPQKSFIIMGSSNLTDAGLGDLYSGEGIVELNRSFLIAGAKSLCLTLWSISDKSTSVLMTEFYRNLSTGISKAKLLRRTKLYVLEKTPYRAPFYWAPFILVGAYN